MVLPNKVAIILGIALAVIAALVSFLKLTNPWVAGLQGAVIVLGAFGVQMLSPAQIAAKIPAHVAALAAAGLTAINVFVQADVTLPTAVHAAIGALFAIAAALGITVTGVAVSKAVAALRPVPASGGKVRRAA